MFVFANIEETKQEKEGKTKKRLLVDDAFIHL